MEEFSGDFRCITMDQRNANGGESTGPATDRAHEMVKAFIARRPSRAAESGLTAGRESV